MMYMYCDALYYSILAIVVHCVTVCLFIKNIKT